MLKLLETVRRLRQAGWRIALDDVGADDISIAFMPLLRPHVPHERVLSSLVKNGMSSSRYYLQWTFYPE
jgi:EAL domain-containing protein (putative c-di-GMP-specific phosphodiesterase class I)